MHAAARIARAGTRTAALAAIAVATAFCAAAATAEAADSTQTAPRAAADVPAQERRTLAGVSLAPTTVPGRWEGNGLPPDADGVAWYVAEVTLEPRDLGGDMRLALGRIDDADETWFNGTRIGATDRFDAVRSYPVPAALLRAGVNRIAVKVTDVGGAGGLVGMVPGTPALEGGSAAFDLAGTWWIAAGDHPALAGFDRVMDPDLRARMAPIAVGARRTAIVPLAADGAAPDLWYQRPAAAWTEALPVGNGRLGAMVFGGVVEERLQLNEATVWEGNPDDRNAPAAAASFRAARALALEGKVVEAQEILQRDCMLPDDMMPRSHQTLGDLFVRMEKAPERAEGYRRSLDLRTGIAETRFVADGVPIVREVVADAPDELIAVGIRTEDGRTLPDTRIRLRRSAFGDDDPSHAAIPAAGGMRLSFVGRCGQGGVRYVAIADVRADGGSVELDGTDALVRGARSIAVCISARTDYFAGEPAPEAEADLQSAATGFASLRSRAAEWTSRLMNRVSLDLGGAPWQAGAQAAATPVPLPTDARLARFRTDAAADPALVALHFRYGRYLLLASSRQGSLPANLQGIWNDHFRAPWNADFHTNINVQMNYWHAGPAALAETELPLMDLIDRLSRRGARTARELYGAGGWCCHHITDAWAMTAPEGRTVWGMYPLGGAWLVRHAWEHFAFTQDMPFLRDRAYPMMAGAVEFLLDYLATDPATGRLVSGPSTSPENTFVLPDGRHADVSMGTSMDQWIARDLLVNFLDAAQLLGRSGERLPMRAADALDRLAVPQVGADGRLMEWSRPYGEAEPGHRHMSHLYGLHPASFITPDGAPELSAAARRSLEHRLANGGGHTGWSRAWLINLWARLHDGDRAWADACALLAKSTLPNLFDDHPPFQIDGNFGGAAGIAEMLLQSHVRSWSGGHLVHRIDLLPALPKACPDGRAAGLVARGNVRTEIEWKRGALVRARLESPDGRELRVRLPAGMRRARIAVDGQQPIELPLPDGIAIVPRAAAKAPRDVTITP